MVFILTHRYSHTSLFVTVRVTAATMVYLLDYKEYQTILSIKDKIIENMDETQSTDVSKWFEPPEKDEDFESGIAVGTEVINGKCTFLDKNGLCTLQKIAMQEGEYKWKYKPLYCILFPLNDF